MCDISTKEYYRFVEYLQVATQNSLKSVKTKAHMQILLTLGLIDGTRIELIPPNFTFIFKQRFDSVCGEVLFTFLACTHCVAIPSTVSPTRLTSAKGRRENKKKSLTNVNPPRVKLFNVTINWSFSRQNDHN